MSAVQRRGPLSEALSGALAKTRAALAGPDRAGRWRRFALLAVMAGIVGAGSPPPPIGLFQPAWENPSLREPFLGNPVVVGGLIFLAVFLVLMGGFARSFTFGFLEGIASGQPEPGSYRRNLSRGTFHYVWSSLLTIPLYLVLFAGEALVTHSTFVRLARLIEAPGEGAEQQAVLLILTWALKFLLVLAPWTLVTLPLMVLMYELTPAVMVTRGGGPAPACGRALRLAGSAPGLFWGYLGTRVVVQILGNIAAMIALIPALLVAGVVSVPIMGVAWAAASVAGGPGTSGGVGALTVGGLLSIVALYCVLCTALLPVSVFLNALALEVAGRSRTDHGDTETRSAEREGAACTRT